MCCAGSSSNINYDTLGNYYRLMGGAGGYKTHNSNCCDVGSASMYAQQSAFSDHHHLHGYGGYGRYGRYGGYGYGGYGGYGGYYGGYGGYGGYYYRY